MFKYAAAVLHTSKETCTWHVQVCNCCPPQRQGHTSELELAFGARKWKLTRGSANVGLFFWLASAAMLLRVPVFRHSKVHLQGTERHSAMLRSNVHLQSHSAGMLMYKMILRPGRSTLTDWPVEVRLTLKSNHTAPWSAVYSCPDFV